jgi:hypothetical protein
MSDPDVQSSATPTPAMPQSGRGVLCPSCDHLNPADRDECKYCSKALYTVCPGCSTTQERVLSQCRRCGHSLQSGLLSGLLGSDPVESSSSSRWDGSPSGPKGKGTLCCNCEHLNPTDLERCERCSEALFVDCPNCRKRNARVLMHCASCKGRLHRKPHHKASSGSRSSVPKEAPRVPVPAASGPTVCAKCTHPNPPGLQRCEQCRGHLFVVCRDCGSTNARSEPRCLQCNRRLHRSINERLDPLGAKAVSMKWAYAVLAIVLLSLAGFILIRFSGLRIFE